MPGRHTCNITVAAKAMGMQLLIDKGPPPSKWGDDGIEHSAGAEAEAHSGHVEFPDALQEWAQKGVQKGERPSRQHGSN